MAKTIEAPRAEPRSVRRAAITSLEEGVPIYRACTWFVKTAYKTG
jgi:hypothetical protein